LPVAITETQVTINQDLKALVPYPGINPVYVVYALQAFAPEILAKTAKGGTTVQSIESAQLQRLEIPLAPTAEQFRIVGEIEKQLTRLDAAISSLQRAQKALKSHRAAVLKAACEGRLVPTEAELAKVGGREYVSADQLLQRIARDNAREEVGSPFDEDLATLPQGWCWTRAFQVSEFITKGTTPPEIFLSRGSGEIPYIRVHHLEFDGILHFDDDPIFVTRDIHSTQLRRSCVKPGDVLTNIVGPPLGKVAIVSDTHEEWNINQAVARYRPLYGINRKFFSRILQAENVLGWAKRRAKTTAGQVNLTLEICRNLPIPIAPEAEQNRIVSEVERCLSISEKLAQTIETFFKRARSLRQSLLRDAFLGKLVAQDPTDEPAAVLVERLRLRRESVTEPRPRKSRGIKGEDPTQATLTSPDLGSLPRKGQRHVAWGASPRKEMPNQIPSPEGAAAEQRPGKDRRRPGGAQDLVSDRMPGADAPGYMPLPLAGQDAEPDFLSRSQTEQIDAVWDALLGLGPLEKDEAVRAAAQSLRDQGLASFQRLRQGGPLWEAIATAIGRGVREGSFDRPRRGFVRAILPDARAYTPELWSRCLFDSLDHEPMEEDEALRAAAERARESYGLEFKRLREDGIILGGLRAALQEAVQTGGIAVRSGKVSLKGDRNA
jgi:type I restriction enzyme S subunit